MAYTIQHQNETKALAERGVRIRYQTSNRGRKEWFSAQSVETGMDLFRAPNFDSCMVKALELPVKK